MRNKGHEATKIWRRGIEEERTNKGDLTEKNRCQAVMEEGPAVAGKKSNWHGKCTKKLGRLTSWHRTWASCHGRNTSCCGKEDKLAW